MPVILNGTSGINSPGGDISVSLTTGTLNATTINTTNSTLANLTVTNDASISGLTVGKGTGSGNAGNSALGIDSLPVNTTGTFNTGLGLNALFSNTTGASNTGSGVYALYSNTTGTGNTANGRSALETNSTGGLNTAIGNGALFSNTTASNNTAVGYQALYSNTTGAQNVAIGANALDALTTPTGHVAIGFNAGGSLTVGDPTNGRLVVIGHETARSFNPTSDGSGTTVVGSFAGYSLTTGGSNTFLGGFAGYSVTTGVRNTFVGPDSGFNMTTGSNNVILGRYNGNSGGLDIRTASNHIVLSDGDGNPRGIFDNNGNFIVGTPSESAHVLVKPVSQGARTFRTYSSSTGQLSFEAFAVSSEAYNGAATCTNIGRNSSTLRSINAGGTINASGADYAEYMVKAGNFDIAKGDVCGINANGKLTNVFADAISFVVKSTDPSYVGGDTWGSVDVVGKRPKDDASQEEKDAFDSALEAARQSVDRIAFAGQVPVNVIGATAGQYIVPVNNNGSIKGEAVSNPTFEQYQNAVGKVIAVEADGRARIIVKVA
jgi:hypothetical protein